MSKLWVSARLVDGGLYEFEAEAELLVRLQQLQAEGIAGKQLIHRLITDDWGAPPTFIDITGSAPDGSVVDVRIPYR